MTANSLLESVAKPIQRAIEITVDGQILVQDQQAVRQNIDQVVRNAVFGSVDEKHAAQWLVRECALHLGIILSSIHKLYVARAAGKVSDDFTVQAMKLRSLPFYAAKAAFRAAGAIDVKAMIFELARSEMGYTEQPPAEYVTNILGAAIAEGYQGPIFVQGDHYQVSKKRFEADAQAEIEAIRDLCTKSIQAGIFNIDIDTSTLVDLSKQSIFEQQQLNYSICADFSSFIRECEPEGLTISLGGEIGEVGGQNSTEAELRAFMKGFERSYRDLKPEHPGLSKISIQTGTSHGGIVLADGSIAEVNVDFDTLKQLSRVAKEFGMGGAVQHGASTLPEDAFSRFAEANALEVHLATIFQNIMYNRIDDPLREGIYKYLRENHSNERKSDQTDEQFYYKTRKRALGSFKKALWDMDTTTRENIEAAWEQQFTLLFERLNVAGTKEEIEQHIQPLVIHEPLSSYLQEVVAAEDTSDLAD